MSVPVGKRRLSEMEFFHNAVKLRKEITFLLLRNFGVKERYVREMKTIRGLKVLNETDKETFLNIMDKYNIGGDMLFTYPQWLLSHFRESLLQLMRDLMMNIVKANTIYPTSLVEAQERRAYQNRAICACECMLQEFNHINEVIPVDANKLKPFIELADKEVNILKNWRKSDNKFFRRFKLEEKNKKRQ